MNQSGYIALVSTIIIAALLMVVAFTISSNSFLTRFNILSTEFKEKSFNLAEACVDMALLKLAQNQSYVGNESILIGRGDDRCLILPIETLAGQKIIKTRAIFQGAVTNLKVAVRDSDLSIISWEELPKF